MSAWSRMLMSKYVALKLTFLTNLILLNDNSGAQQINPFIRNIVIALDIGEDQTHVSMVTYANEYVCT